MAGDKEIEATAYAVVKTAWCIRKLTLWLEALVGLPLMVVGFGFLRIDFAFPVGLVLLLGPFVVALPSVIYRLLARRRRPRTAVLWIRRFHQGKKATNEQAMLEWAVADWGELITLSDTSVDTDVARRMMLSWWYLVISCLLFLIATITIRSGLTMFLSLVGGFGWFLWRRRKTARVRVHDPQAVVAKLIKKISLKLRLESSFSTVLRCQLDGDDWRRTISELADVVDAVVVSAAESSPQLDWEMRTLAERLGSPKIVLLTTPGEPRAVSASLENARIIEVPNKYRFWWPGEQLVKPAAVTLGTAILTSRRGRTINEN